MPVNSLVWNWDRLLNVVGHTTWAQSLPQAGTQTNTTIFMIVANPIGNVPTNKLCDGCRSIANQISGYNVYLSNEMMKKSVKSKMFKPNMTTDM